MTLKDKRTEAEKATEAKDDKRENLIALVLVILVLAGIAWWVYSINQPTTDDTVRFPVSVGGSPLLGSKDAEIVVIEFSDFQCPFCAQFALEHFPAIKEQYIDTGQVAFAYKHFPLQSHGKAYRAAQASVCAHNEGVFWEYHDILYENQDALEVNQLLEHANGLDIDEERFRTCLINEESRGEVLEDKNLGIQSGVTGTPTFFFNGRKVVGALTPERFAEEIQKELSEAQ